LALALGRTTTVRGMYSTVPPIAATQPPGLSEGRDTRAGWMDGGPLGPVGGREGSYSCSCSCSRARIASKQESRGGLVLVVLVVLDDDDDRGGGSGRYGGSGWCGWRW